MRKYLRKKRNEIIKLTDIKLSETFPWDDAKLEIAKRLSTGIYTQREIARHFNMAESLISRYKSHPEFMQKVNELTMQYELATKAGLLREINYGIERKRLKIDEDSSTHLQYVKAATEVTGAQAPAQQGSSAPIMIIINQPGSPQRRIIDVTPSEAAEKKEDAPP